MARKNKNSDREAYYTLRAVHATSGSAHNRQLMAGVDIIHIGQTADCEWHFDNTTNYIDEVYAVIRPGQISGEWVLVPTSEYVSVSVNGTKVDLIHYLRDGDIIGFDGERQELRFNVHHDGRYSADIGVVYIPMRLSIGTKIHVGIAAAIAVLAFAFLLYYGKRIANRNEEVNNLLNSYSTAVLQVTVDSVHYVASTMADNGARCDSVLGCYVYSRDGGGTVSGTAFIADDTLLITARHCIKPWFNDTIINRVSCPSDLPEGPVRWAFEAETINQLSGNKDSLRLVSYCTIWGGMTGTTPVGHYTSDDFCIDETRDDIVPKGDFYNDFYWRSIIWRGKLTEQVLGDVACVTIEPSEGIKSLHLADDDYMKKSLTRGRNVYFIGYPNYQNKGLETQTGTLKKDYKGNELLWHDGNITHGYSGGPVVVIDRNDLMGEMKVMVVGVISIADSKGLNRTYSVPVTEIKNEKVER